MHIRSNFRKIGIVLGVSLLCISVILIIPFNHSKFILTNSEEFENLNGWTIFGDQKYVSIIAEQGGKNSFVQLVSDSENFSYMGKPYEMQNSVMASVVFQYKQINLTSYGHSLVIYLGNFFVSMDVKEKNTDSFVAIFTVSNEAMANSTLEINKKHILNFYVIGERFIGIREIPLLRVIVELDNVEYVTYSTKSYLPQGFQMMLGIGKKTDGTNILNFYEMKVYRIKPLVVNDNVEFEEQPIALVTIEIPVTMIIIGILLVDASLHVQKYPRVKQIS